MSASIILKNLRVATLIGVYDFEKDAPQALRLDLELALKTTAASLSDKLRDTVDYDAVVAAIRRFASGKGHELLESFTYEMAQMLLNQFPLKHVRITAWKTIAAHAPTEIAVRVVMAAGERWTYDDTNEDDRFND